MQFKSLMHIGLFTISAAVAAPNPKEAAYEIHFAEHRFTPMTLVVPADQPLELKVMNSSNERIEFESFKLNREKIVGPGETVTLHLPPLRAGSYDFYDDFHQDVPEGAIVAR